PASARRSGVWASSDRSCLDWSLVVLPLGEWRHVQQCSNQAQQGLLLWSVSLTEKVAQLDARQLATRRRIRLVNDEGASICPEKARVCPVSDRREPYPLQMQNRKPATRTAAGSNRIRLSVHP